ncbi:MAG TPA: alkaline phosphatase family protein [Desulfomonilaceae bacterium]|nr:alkaline phosphatase family protein [Desulfomonilaceae bacterium]
MANSSNPLRQIKHIVVLMMENRSFDNLLGWLYDPENNQAPFNQPPPSNFEGLYGKDLSNPGSEGPIPVGEERDPTYPRPDPGETYENVYCQLYNEAKIPALDQVPLNPPQPPPMQGFVTNYSVQPSVIDPKIIMNCFRPQSVPVLSSLAYYYGVCDHWFASIPSETLCNRSFLYSGTSSGYVNNEGGNGLFFVNRDTPTIFSLLEEVNISWKIYCASWIITSLALLTQARVMWRFLPTHFAYLDEFFNDAKRPNGLPTCSFIEPIYMDSPWGAENDMHPEAWPAPFAIAGPSNLQKGEALLYKVYQAVRNSPDWNSTLLIIIFDEHGGCYDHVPPPSAIPPDNIIIESGQRGCSGFRFDRLGVRVPAIVVSPFTPQQAIVNDCFDHTSVLSTIAKSFDLFEKQREQLGQRQANALDLSKALTLSVPRTDFPPIPQPPSHILGEMKAELNLLAARREPISKLQKAILNGITHIVGEPPALQDTVANIHTVAHAWEFLEEKKSELRQLLARKPNI